MRIALTLLFLASSLAAQEDREEISIPPVRPQDDFYDAAGRGITIRFEVEKRQVTALDWFALTLVVEKVENPEQMTVPDLRKLSEFRQRFDFKESPPKKRLGEKRCEIVYIVRAKDDSVKQVPAFRFRYYSVGTDTGSLALDFPTTLSPSVPLKVRPVEVPPSPVQPLEPAAFLVNPDDHLDLLATDPPPPEGDGFNPIWLIPPVLGGAWVLLWRWRYPDEARLARIRQSRAARRALARLLRSEGTKATVTVFLEYLRERFGVEDWRTTPEEVRDGLKGSVAEARLRSEIIDELRRTDRLRFSLDSQSDDLAVRFKELIFELEEAAP
jgi:hypothetical protein